MSTSKLSLTHLCEQSVCCACFPASSLVLANSQCCSLLALALRSLCFLALGSSWEQPSAGLCTAASSRYEGREQERRKSALSGSLRGSPAASRNFYGQQRRLVLQGRWRAQLSLPGHKTQLHLGTFDSEISAGECVP